jgi:plastocyanin
MEYIMSLRILWKRQPLATLGIVTMLALIGQVLALASLMLIAGVIIPPLLILGVIAVVIAALVATGLKWMPLVGALYCIGTMIGGLVSQQYLPYHLTHPGEVGFFIAALLIYVFSILAVCAGIGATVQNYHSIERRTPPWLAPVLTSLVGFVLGAFLVAMLVAMTPQTAVGTATVNGMPAVHLGVSSFTPSSVTVPKGSKLVLIDDGQFPHILRNGMWVNNTPHPATELGAPTVSNLHVNGNTVEIGPFNTIGTFHIFCTIHPGMNLTIVVQ